jgi:hypothetical protein
VRAISIYCKRRSGKNGTAASGRVTGNPEVSCGQDRNVRIADHTDNSPIEKKRVYSRRESAWF